MQQCVYCQEEKELPAFTTEHVVHRAFGGFESNLTLSPSERPAVCHECNQYFGNGIDRDITRDSYEAFQRLFHGHKQPHEFRELLAFRVVISLPEESPHGPLLLELGPPIQGRPGLYLVPQVRFQNQLGEFVCVPEPDLAERNPITDPTLRRGPVAIFSSFPEAEGRLRTRLEELGLAPQEWKEVPDLPSAGVREMDLELQGSVDGNVARAVAKIGFNYLAWGKGVQFALRSEFDPIRSFIRFGHGSWRDFVEMSPRPILMDDTPEARHTQGHLLTVGFAGGLLARLRGHIVAQVSLYNTMTYRIHLCRQLRGLWLDVSSGHHYNLNDRRVERLGNTRLARPASLKPIVWN